MQRDVVIIGVAGLGFKSDWNHQCYYDMPIKFLLYYLETTMASTFDTKSLLRVVI